MNDKNGEKIITPAGVYPVDAKGSPVGVVRMDPEQSYAGIGDLLAKYINHQNRESWDLICKKIDYTFENFDLALSPLALATNFKEDITKEVRQGKKLLFKPNLVFPTNIDPQTHGPGMGSTACTEWPFIAALMRWFHEKLNITYSRMCIGEAATAMSACAAQFTVLNNGPITTEAVIEGRSGDFYGGWGFYFVRKYLRQRQATDERDNPMNGYEESISGTYIPPGKAADKLMVYDLNRIFDEPSKGRRVPVADGVNYQSIMLHKVIVGGDPENDADPADYPGCILINVPKFKVHAIALFTNVIKNLGIGLYPMQYARQGGCKWDYSAPDRAIPGMKAKIPHQVWVPEIDAQTLLPKQDENGNARVEKTGGITATMIDIIRAVMDQNVYMLHVVDAVEGINLDHQGIGVGVKEPEGMVFAGTDPVAVDLLSARYMFCNVPMEKSLAYACEDGYGGRFPQAVAVPAVEGNNIVSTEGFDCPLSRDVCFGNAENRGLGKTKYHVVGHDGITGLPLASIKGHPGIIRAGRFSDIVTSTLYFDVYKMPWDLQKTAFGYFDAVDQLTGAALKQNFLEAFDEDKDGIVSYEEMGKQGEWTYMLYLGGEQISTTPEILGALKCSFKLSTARMKASDPAFNAKGSDLLKVFSYGAACTAAFQMSQVEIESPDPFIPGLMWGNGKWPGFHLARYVSIGFALFGKEFPEKAAYPSLYYMALRYADLTQNQGKYLGAGNLLPDDESVWQYVRTATDTPANQLDFTLYVPEGYDSIGGAKLPNVVATADPATVFTATFNGGKEVWH